MTGRDLIHARFQGDLGLFHLDIELKAPMSGVTVITGPSGSGKTSVLRCLAGLTRLEGTLRIGGDVWQDARQFRAPHLRDIGMVFQQARLMPHLSVLGNLEFGARRIKTPGAIHRDEVIDLLGLEPLLHRRTPGLSGGEQQRIAIGRALLSQPRLMLMDEPTSSLDVDARAEVVACVQTLPERLGIPVLYVTHDPIEAMRLGQSRIRLAAGRVAESFTGQSLEDTARSRLAGLSPEQRDRLALAALGAGFSIDDQTP